MDELTEETSDDVQDQDTGTPGVSDPYFSIEVLSSTEYPQTIVYQALHQCYSSNPVSASTHFKVLDEKACGDIIVRRLLAGNRGHYSPLEMASLVLSCKYFNHGTVQQITRHRTGISFGIQSFRYTSDSIIKAATGSYEDVEKAFYLRPLGRYMSRNGCDYEYTEKQRAFHLEHCRYFAQKYVENINEGMAEEQARGLLPFDYRSHFVMGLNARTLMHLLDMRSKKDAQLEIQWFSNLLLEKFQEFMPEVCAWYQENRYSKARLAP